MSKPLVAMPAEFIALSAESRTHNEYNDCAIKAVVIATGAPYAQVRKMMEDFGRKSRKGTNWSIIRKTVEALGFKVHEWNWREHDALIASYSPKAPTWYKRLTTGQVKAYNKKWRALPCQNMLLFSSAHVSAYKDGEVIDWAHNKAKRIWLIWEVTKS